MKLFISCLALSFIIGSTCQSQSSGSAFTRYISVLRKSIENYEQANPTQDADNALPLQLIRSRTENRDAGWRRARRGFRGRGRRFRVLYHLQNVIYSPWSEWSECSKRCKTHRYRVCQISDFCGTNVIQEHAICYSEGTPCEHLYIGHAESRKKSKKSNMAVPQDVLSEETCGRSSVSADSGPTPRQHLRIIGGSEAVRGKWPWQVVLLNRFKEPFCGGTILSPNYVLTAAHCARKRLFVRAGEHDLVNEEGSEQEIKVKEVIQHPEYDPERVINDIAILRLKHPLRMDTYVGPACIPRSDEDLGPDSGVGTILGWGKRKNSALFGSDVLNEAQVPIVNTTACRQVYANFFISDSQACAGFRRGRVDSCAGDSGGPLLLQNPQSGRWTIYGVTSFGEGCGQRGKYGVYTKVPHYVDWIKSVVEGGDPMKLMTNPNSSTAGPLQ